MMNFKKRFCFPNNLPFRIFAFFWSSFAIIFISTLVLPFLLDDSEYRELSQKEISVYHAEIINFIRSRQLSGIIAGTHRLPMDELRPILVDKTGEIWGARDDEISLLKQFMEKSFNPVKPLQKNFYGTRITGPFVIHLDVEKREPYSIYFVYKINQQQEFTVLAFNHPIIPFLLVMFVSSPLLWWLSISIGRPLRRLQKAANMVALGNFTIDKSLENESTAELRQVGKSFNQMTQALDNLLSHQQNLLSSISHELRTPLTRLQLSLALLRRTHGDIPILNRIEKESALIDRMVNDLLLLSRQQLKSHLTRSTFPINHLWDDVLDNAEFEATQKKVKLKIIQLIDAPEEYMINGNEELLVSAIENVVRNALKYTKSYLEVKMRIWHQHVYIYVDDNGIGVPESEYENIFKPFYRIDEARTRESGGAGLGLALVASIVKEHQGEVWAEKSHLGGLRVSIALPLWDF